jgi:hypothetical protein
MFMASHHRLGQKPQLLRIQLIPRQQARDGIVAGLPVLLLSSGNRPIPDIHLYQRKLKFGILKQFDIMGLANPHQFNLMAYLLLFSHKPI